MTARGLSDVTGRLALTAGAAIVLGGTLAALLVAPRLGRPSASSPSPTSRLDVSGDWRPVAWAPDGTRLLVSGSAGFALVGLRAAPPPGLSGADVAAWRPASGHELALVQPSGTPDGSTLSYIGDDTGPAPLPLPVAGASTIAWAADGRTWALAAQPGPGVVLGRVGPGEALIRPDLGAPFALSPDGAILAAREVTTGALALLPGPGADLSEGLPAAIAPAPITIGADGLLAFSPDGRWLALADEAEGLRVMPADASTPPTTIAAEVVPSSVTWAAHLDQLLALRSGAAQTAGIEASLTAAGIEVRQLGSARSLDWAADGGVILVLADGQVIQQPLPAGGRPVVLATDADPAWPALQGRGGALAYRIADGLRVLGP